MKMKERERNMITDKYDQLESTEKVNVDVYSRSKRNKN